MTYLPSNLYIQTRAKMAEYEAQASQERLLREASGSMRVQLASLFQQFTAMLTPKPAQPTLKPSRQH